MSNLAYIREICSQALDQLASAEKVHKETIDELNIGTQGNRQRTIQLDDEIEQTLFGLRSRTEAAWTRSARILAELKLNRVQPEVYSPPTNQTIQEGLNHMRALTLMSEETVQELEIVAQQLQKERKNWWKFW